MGLVFQICAFCEYEVQCWMENAYFRILLQLIGLRNLFHRVLQLFVAILMDF